jgi:putative membrane protein
MSERKLARAGIAVGAAQDLRQALVPLLVILVVSGGAIDSAGEAIARFGLYGVLGLGLAIGMGYWRWVTTWWSIGDGAVRLRTGLLESKVRTIPLDRLQSVDASQGPVQRLFGVQQLKLQAAGTGKEAEILLLALDATQVAEIRAALSATDAPDEAESLDEPAPAGPEWRLRPGMLLAAGITSAQFGFLIPIAAAAGQAVDDISEPLIGHFREDGGAPAATEIALAILAIVTAAWLIAFAGTVIAFTGHRVERRRDRLIVMRGLFVRREASLPVARVQGVRLVDGLLRQPFGLTQIRVETAGYADERAYEQTLFPLLRRSQVPAFLDELLPELAGSFEELSRPPARAARRYVTPVVAVAVVVGAVPAALLGPTTWWPLPAALIVLAALYGFARYGAAGWSLDPVRLVVRERRVARHTVIARRSSIDIRTARQNPWQRRARLADLRFAIASKRRFGVDHLDEAEVNGAIAALVPRAVS